MKISASVIIPAYNESQTISCCLSSICAYNSSDFEIIVVNDCSTDDTKEVVTNYPDLRIRVIDNSQNMGPASSLNVGANLAVGEVLVFIDADCVASRNWLCEALNLFSKPDVVAVEGPIYYEGDVSDITQRVPINPFYNTQKSQSLVVPGRDYANGNFAIKREVFKSIGGFRCARYPNGREDTDLGLRVNKLGKIAYSEKMSVTHKIDYWSFAGLIKNCTRYEADVKISKDYNYFPFKSGIILHPRFLLAILFPPVIFWLYNIRSFSSLSFLPKLYLYFIVLRVRIWKAAIQERVFVL